MNRLIPHKSLPGVAMLVFCSVMMLWSFSFKPGHSEPGKLKITFVNTANGKAIVLRDSMYVNAFGERYSVSKLKYYISHASVPGNSQPAEADPYHLINAADTSNSFEIALSAGRYHHLQFDLGVDSSSNNSGAQTGALDPMNDMFWTWNTGYVMFKLEGTSDASNADMHRIEHHIAGYKGQNNVVTRINLGFPATKLLQIEAGKVTSLTIKMDLDRYWKGATNTMISEAPLCTTTGQLATKISTNFAGMFSIDHNQ